MQIITSSLARPELRPYVRAYAQRVCGTDDSDQVISVPAQLEQILNFELGSCPGFIIATTWYLTWLPLAARRRTFRGTWICKQALNRLRFSFSPQDGQCCSKRPSAR